MKFCGRKGLFPVLIVLMLLLSACSQTGGTAPFDGMPSVGYQTEMGEKLRQLPPPKQKIVVAVYDFADHSGQYEEGTTSTNFSTALSQGNTELLIEVLKKSGWFEVIERKGLNNLLTERKIIAKIRNLKAQQLQQDIPPMPTLLFAEYLIEGGITSYEKNIHSGGLGVAFTGIGGSLEVRQDTVTVSIRSINTANGRVTASLAANNSVYSQRMGANIFRFIRYKELLEAEAGYSRNEPRLLCVQEAIEKAVHDLIMENVLAGTWELQDPTQIDLEPFIEYLSAVKQATPK